MSQKSYNNTPAVYLIPTPIGNMEDITIRSINILKTVDIIFSEDTRETRELLKYLGIDKKLISSHKYNENDNINKLLKYLQEGNNIGIVTDRGTPAISDPGYILVKQAIANNYNVIALPGATAFVPALIASGISTDHFLFYGFLNPKSLKKELESLSKIKYTLIFYEAPHRISKTLTAMLEVFGNRHISLSREISKKYEEIYRGPISIVSNEIIGAKGEMVIIVTGNKEEHGYNNLTIIEHVNLYIKEGYSTMDAIKKVAKDRKVAKSDIYSEYNR